MEFTKAKLFYRDKFEERFKVKTVKNKDGKIVATNFRFRVKGYKEKVAVDLVFDEIRENVMSYSEFTLTYTSRPTPPFGAQYFKVDQALLRLLYESDKILVPTFEDERFNFGGFIINLCQFRGKGITKDYINPAPFKVIAAVFGDKRHDFSKTEHADFLIYKDETDGEVYLHKANSPWNGFGDVKGRGEFPLEVMNFDKDKRYYERIGNVNSTEIQLLASSFGWREKKPLFRSLIENNLTCHSINQMFREGWDSAKSVQMVNESDDICCIVDLDGDKTLVVYDEVAMGREPLQVKKGDWVQDDKGNVYQVSENGKDEYGEYNVIPYGEYAKTDSFGDANLVKISNPVVKLDPNQIVFFIEKNREPFVGFGRLIERCGSIVKVQPLIKSLGVDVALKKFIGEHYYSIYTDDERSRDFFGGRKDCIFVNEQGIRYLGKDEQEKVEKHSAAPESEAEEVIRRVVGRVFYDDLLQLDYLTYRLMQYGNQLPWHTVLKETMDFFDKKTFLDYHDYLNGEHEELFNNLEKQKKLAKLKKASASHA